MIICQSCVYRLSCCYKQVKKKKIIMSLMCPVSSSIQFGTKRKLVQTMCLYDRQGSTVCCGDLKGVSCWRLCTPAKNSISNPSLCRSRNVYMYLYTNSISTLVQCSFWSHLPLQLMKHLSTVHSLMLCRTRFKHMQSVQVGSAINKYSNCYAVIILQCCCRAVLLFFFK